MSRSYYATPLWGLSRKSAAAGIFSWKSPGYTSILFLFLFFATPQIKMKTIQEKIERMDLTMARRPKGNYEAYIN